MSETDKNCMSPTSLQRNSPLGSWGLRFLALVLITILFLAFYFSKSSTPALKQPSAITTHLLAFEQIYEPSGVLQLKDGRFIIIEDEPERPFHLLSLDATGKMIKYQSFDILFRNSFRQRLNDLEAITMGPDGYIYAATSHNRNKKGKRKASREQLIRFKINGNSITDTGIVTNLYAAIKASGALGEIDKQGKSGLYNINIEALSFNKNNQLMICLRKPQINKKSVILIIENPKTMFSNKEMPLVSKTPILLDINGSGIRAMSYDSRLNGYLLTNESYADNDHNTKHSQLYFWSGNPEQQPKPIKLPSLKNIKNIEGIAPINTNNDSRILLISDNGDITRKLPANYLFLNYHQLKTQLELNNEQPN